MPNRSTIKNSAGRSRPLLPPEIVQGIMASKPRTGRPAYEPTEADRKAVMLMSAAGVPQDTIAGVLGIARMTLRKHFAAEVDEGLATADARVAASLVARATDLDHPGGTVAAIFYAKARLGWSDQPARQGPELVRHRHEHLHRHALVRARLAGVPTGELRHRVAGPEPEGKVDRD